MDYSCVTHGPTSPNNKKNTNVAVTIMRISQRKLQHGATPAETCFAVLLHTSFSQNVQHVTAVLRQPESIDVSDLLPQ